VMKANKFTGENVVVIHKTYTQPFDVKILHQTRQPRSKLVTINCFRQML